MVDVNLKTEAGREYLQIVVDPYPNPVSYKGEFHYRSGSTKQVLRGAALSRFLLKKYGRTWDDAPLPGVGLKDLDGRTLDEFRRRAAASERLGSEILDESDAGVIEKLRLREGAYLKRAAMLLFHPEPGRFVRDAYVKIGYFRGAELLYQDVIEGDLFAQVDRTMDLLYSKYSRALVSYDGVYRVETFPVPRDAMREAVINAVIHRDYAEPVPIQIRVYDERIVLWNPGRLPGDWSVERLTGEHASVPYNPAIAYAFFRAGMIEAWGRGIWRIATACEDAGNPSPEWKIEPGSGLWLEFRYSVAYRAADAVADGASGEGAGTARARTGGTEQDNGSTTVEGRVGGRAGGRAVGTVRDAGNEVQPESRPESRPESQPESLEAKLLTLLAGGSMAKAELSKNLGQKGVSGQLNKVMRRLLANRMIEYTLPDKPRSRLQQYRLTDRGRAAVANPPTGSS